MNYKLTCSFFCLILLSVFTAAQQDTTAAKRDSTLHKQATADSIPAVKKTSDSTATNCYKQWYDAFSTRGAKPVTDGTQEVVITFKSGETCHCFMGKVEVAAGKIKPPLYVQQENGQYKTFAEMSKKLDPEFVSAQGDQLYKITDGMSVLFKTADNEYGRLFFYKFVNKGTQTNKQAPSPDELLKE